MSHRPIVLCDVDDVVAQLVPVYLREANRMYDMDKRYEDVTSWEFFAALGLSYDKGERVWDSLSDNRAAMDLSPEPGAIEQVKRLMSFADVVFVTSPLRNSPTWAYDRQLWLQEHFGYHVKVIFTKHKQYVNGDYMIDDRPENVLSWREAQFKSQFAGLLIKRPWNNGSLTLEKAVDIVERYSK